MEIAIFPTCKIPIPLWSPFSLTPFHRLSGGDLYEIYLPVTENDLIDLRDGDYYTVIWDSRLLVTKEHPPMDYTPSLPKRVDRPIVVDDVKDVSG